MFKISRYMCRVDCTYPGVNVIRCVAEDMCVDMGEGEKSKAGKKSLSPGEKILGKWRNE